MPKAKLRTMQQKDLEMVLSWRNHPEIRRHMFTDHIITMEEHTAWFQAVSKDKTRHLKLLEINDTPAGFLNITQHSVRTVADWSFHLAPGAAKGSGTLLGEAGLHFGFEQLGLHKICGQALAINQRSVKFHQRFGFQQEGELRDQHFDGERYHSVLCFGLLHDEWRSYQGANTSESPRQPQTNK